MYSFILITCLYLMVVSNKRKTKTTKNNKNNNKDKQGSSVMISVAFFNENINMYEEISKIHLDGFETNSSSYVKNGKRYIPMGITTVIEKGKNKTFLEVVKQ